jgi:hypothetical protein
MVRRRRGGEVGLPARRLHCGRQKEVEQARIGQIAGLVIRHFLAHGDGQRLVSPPWTWPSMIIGLMRVPQLSSA